MTPVNRCASCGDG